ncbi:TraK family protein [Pseudomonas sp.]|uniref:TraK family protein n=1 Tax=Pseudomonas sp. TaxID=306 RepID=UPI003A985EFA
MSTYTSQAHNGAEATKEDSSVQPKTKTLSERIAAHVMRKPDASIAARNRSAFISMREEIQQAYSSGWSLLAIWKLLHEEQRIPFTYQAFRRYARQLITAPQPSQSAKQEPIHPRAITLSSTATKGHLQ